MPAWNDVVKDGRRWQLGTQFDVAWIQDGTDVGRAITAAIPPVFEAYAVVIIGEEPARRRAGELALLGLLDRYAAGRSWWLGYLDTGAHDVVFGEAPRVPLYARWPYVLVEAGAAQASVWREDNDWRGRLPDLMFPSDRSWLVSMLWDDDWRCLGGPAGLIDAVLDEPVLQSYGADVDDRDVTPPGFTAR